MSLNTPQLLWSTTPTPNSPSGEITLDLTPDMTQLIEACQRALHFHLTFDVNKKTHRLVLEFEFGNPSFHLLTVSEGSHTYLGRCNSCKLHVRVDGQIINIMPGDYVAFSE